MENFVNKKLGAFGISKDLRKTNKHDLLESYDFSTLYPSARAD